jgi:hypothetical protein
MFCCKMKATLKYPFLLSDWYNKPSPLPREWLGKSHIHSFGIVRIGKLFLLMSFLGCLAPLPPPPSSPSHSSTNTHSPSSTSITSHFTFTPVSKRSVVNRDFYSRVRREIFANFCMLAILFVQQRLNRTGNILKKGQRCIGVILQLAKKSVPPPPGADPSPPSIAKPGRN